MNNFRSYERAVDIGSCLSILKEIFLQRSIVYKLECFNKAFDVYKCRLTDLKSKKQFIGGGCGADQKGKVSAIAEAFQHYITFTSTEDNPDTIYYSSINEMFYKHAIPENKLPSQLINKNTNRIYPWLCYESLAEGDNFFYPLCLTEVRTEYLSLEYPINDLLWRSHDTGQAIGFSKEEALLHGINEWIERDAYGIFLIKHFLKSPPDEIRIIKKESLPKHLFEKISSLETLYKENIVIIDITSDIGVPTFLVKFQCQVRIQQATGIATSLSKTEALERALDEAIQSHALYNNNTLQFYKAAISHLSSTPLLLDAFICDISSKSSAFNEISFDFIDDYSNLINLEAQIDFLRKKLKIKNVNIYYRVYYNNGLYAIGTIIPRLEEFFLVKNGKYVFPNNRGMCFLKGLDND
ncbi:hypothetical protein CbuD7D7780_04335 [Coxiella burnetii]|uniref:Hypothetical cytosolic protein n=1 Tax=Coxiella burnetii (strain Dugway 5J108-111) TaxID=434922 RepID=A9KFD2_COXBN|nr:YcaO-like family protein [Coxiella burnetii]ABS77309.1 hypothetical cytosolic protein [Coxiella burnetii Dugway 5J108-111]OYK80336.1 hypothetical protein CbuD7E6568_04315 [Coxiella burnetii]OYK82456.1 hypothetical protein CbuD7D7780_04335 [Coxiella burnetii]